MNEPKHALAVLRRIIGLKQKEMGDLVGRSLATIQGIEYNKMPLSEGLANDIAVKTGVCVTWLLKQSDRAPYTDSGIPYTKEVYERTRSNQLDQSSVLNNWPSSIRFLYDLPDMFCIMLSAYEAGEERIFEYRFRTFLAELRKQFPGYDDLREKWTDHKQGKGPFADRLAEIVRQFIDANHKLFLENCRAAMALAAASKKTTSKRRPRSRARGN